MEISPYENKKVHFIIKNIFDKKRMYDVKNGTGRLNHGTLQHLNNESMN